MHPGNVVSEEDSVVADNQPREILIAQRSGVTPGRFIGFSDDHKLF
jgi:hypothetical protein